jgi:predicted ATPase
MKNFRLLKNVKFPLNKLNLVWGPNGSGKSTLVEAIYFLKQNINTPLKFPIVGDNIFKLSYGNFEDIISFRNISNKITIGIGISIESNFRLILNKYISSLNELYSKHKIDYILPIQGDVLFYEIEFYKKDEHILFKISYYLEDKLLISFENKYEGTFITTKFNPSIITNNDETLINEQSCNILSDLHYNHSGSYPEIIINISYLVNSINHEFRNILNKYYLIKTNRSSIPIYQDVKQLPDWVGLEGNYSIEFLSHIWGNKKYENIKSKISKWANEFGLSDLNAGWYNNNLLHSDFKDKITNDIYSLSFAGAGSRQLIPVIAQLFFSEKGSIIVVEEPEISLSLKWQDKLINMIYEAVKEGKKIILTTHSPDLIPILERYLKSHKELIKDTSIYQTEYNSTNGSKFEEILISDKGNIQLPKYIKNSQDELMGNFIDNIKSEEE